MDSIAQLVEDFLQHDCAAEQDSALEEWGEDDDRVLQLLLTAARLRGSALALPESLRDALERRASVWVEARRASAPLAAAGLAEEVRALGGRCSVAPSDGFGTLVPDVIRVECHRCQPHDDDGGAGVVREGVPISELPMWASSRRFYADLCAEAWSGTEAVPSEATCNGYAAQCLARAALAFRRDVEQADAVGAPSRRLVVVDVGAGHAALTFLVAQALQAEPSLGGRVLVLATDFNGALLEERVQIPAFAPLLLDPGDDAQLVGIDFAVFDLCAEEASSHLLLLHSRASLSELLGSAACCFFFMCCYIFDSLPADFHILRRGARGEVEASELLGFPLRAGRSGAHIEPSPPRTPRALSDRYPDGSLSSVTGALVEAARHGPSVLRAVPVAGVHALRRLQSLASGAPWAVAVADEPLDIEDTSQGLAEITPRPGAFAVAVDFAALDAAFRAVAGGAAAVRTWASHKALEGVVLQVMACAGGGDFLNLRAALEIGPIGRLSLYDYLIVITVARQLACRGAPRSPESQARDRAIVDFAGGDAILRRALARTARGEVRQDLLARTGADFPGLAPSTDVSDDDDAAG